jgi:hypothetical protein
MNLHDHCIAGLSFDARPPNARQQPVLKASSFKFNVVPKQIFVAQHHGIVTQVTEWTNDRGALLSMAFWRFQGAGSICSLTFEAAIRAENDLLCASLYLCVVERLMG